MNRERSCHCVVWDRGVSLPCLLRALVWVIVVVGVALFVPAAPLRGASGYRKPDVDARTLKRAQNSFDDGVELYQRRNYRAALRKFVAAERTCPELFAAGYHVALVHRKMKDEEAAISQFRKLNGLFPENIIAHNDLGVIFAGKNEARSDRMALAEFRSAIENGEALLRGEEKNIPQVRIDLAMAYANFGALRLRNSDFADAEKSFRKAVEHNPRAFFGHFGLGNVLFATKEYTEAKAAYRRAQQIEPDNVSAHIAMARCYVFGPQKNPRFAIAELRKVPAENAPAEVFDLFGDAYTLLEDTEEARRNYARYAVLPGRSPQVLYKLGVLCYNEGDREEAKSYLEEFVAEAPQEQEEALSTAYKVLGDIFREEKDYGKALVNYRKGAELRKAYISCYYGLADSYFHLKRYEEAKEYLLLVLKGLPKSGSAEENELREKAAALLKKIPSQE